jgi:hypothetical protein
MLGFRLLTFASHFLPLGFALSRHLSGLFSPLSVRNFSILTAFPQTSFFNPAFGSFSSTWLPLYLACGRLLRLPVFIDLCKSRYRLSGSPPASAFGLAFGSFITQPCFLLRFFKLWRINSLGFVFQYFNQPLDLAFWTFTYGSYPFSHIVSYVLRHQPFGPLALPGFP